MIKMLLEGFAAIYLLIGCAISVAPCSHCPARWASSSQNLLSRTAVSA
jgi:hypothetical protein